MAKLAVTVAGGLVGGLIGGPLGAQIGMTLGGALGASLFGPTTHGPRLDDLTVTTSTYGNAIPEVYGTTRVSGNMIWSSGIKETKEKSGGKGGPKQVSYSYSASFAIAICKGEIDGLLRMWGDSKLIFGETPVKVSEQADGGFLQGEFRTEGSKKKTKYNFRIYKGSEEQLPDSIIEADIGVGRTPGYRGLAYIVFEDMPLEDFGNRIPSLSFEISRSISRVLPEKRPRYPSGSAATNATFFTDWETNRLVRVRDGVAYVFSLSTMEEIGRYATGISTNRIAFSPNNGPIYGETGASNNRKVRIYDGTTFAKLQEIGIYSNRIPADPVSFCQGNGPYYGALQFFGNCTVTGKSGREDYRLATTWKSEFQIYVGESPVWFEEGKSKPSTYIQGRQGKGESDAILFRNYSPTASIERYTITSGSRGKITTTPGPHSSCPSEGNNAVQARFSNSPGVTKYDRIQLTPNGRNFSATVALYDKTDDSIFMLGTFRDTGKRGAFKYLVSDNAYKWIREYDTSFALPGGRMRNSRIEGGKFGWLGAIGRFTARGYIMDLQTGDWEYHGNSFRDYGGYNYKFPSQSWDDRSQSLVVNEPSFMNRYYFRESSSTVTVGSIVSDIFLRTGVLTESDFDTSEIDDIPVRGYTVTRESSARDVLGQLATMYLFDGVESDYQIKIKKRGGDPDVYIDESWLGHVADRDVQVRETRSQELELPMRVSLVYLEYDRDYQAGTQFSKRNVNPVPTMQSLREEKVEVPIVMEADEAKQFTDKALKAAWAGRASYEMKLPWRYLKYDPSDIAEVSLDDGTTYRMRFNEVTMGADMTMETSGTSERAAAYVSNVQADGGQGVPVQYAANSDPSQPVIINTPLIRDLDDTQGRASLVYLGALSRAGRFRGARIHQSMNDDDFDAVHYVDSEAVSGYCLNGLPATKSWAGTDKKTELIVRLSDPDMELESVSDEELLTEYKNAALVGYSEIIQFRDAELLEDGTYKLTNILRARRGTSYWVNNHLTSNDPFVLLDEKYIGIEERPPESFETTRYYKSVAPGEITEEVDSYARDLLPIDLMPYTPADVKVTDDGTNITVSFVRRSRINAPMVNNNGLLHYKEGQPNPQAKWEVWNGRDLNNIPFAGTGGSAVVLQQLWATDNVYPDTEGFVDFFFNGIDQNRVSFQIPLTDVVTGSPGDQESFLFRIREIGYVPGIPVIMEAHYVDTGKWNIRAIY